MLTFDDASSNPWLSNNAVRDVAAGFVDPAEIYLDHGAAYASMTGTYAVTGTVTDVSCDGQCLPSSLAVGDPLEFSYTFEPRPLDGTSYTWTAGGDQPCGWDDDGDGAIDRETGVLAGSDPFTITPTTVTVRDGQPIGTEFTGTLTTSYSVATGVCFDGAFLGQRITGTITGSR